MTDRAPWKNPRVLFTLLFVFLAGLLAGASVMHMKAPPEKHKVGPYWNEGGKEITLQRFRKELNLTDKQASEVETILDDFMNYIQTLEAQINDVRSTGKKRIMRVLDEGQKQKFEHMMKEARDAQ